MKQKTIKYSKDDQIQFDQFYLRLNKPLFITFEEAYNCLYAHIRPFGINSFCHKWSFDRDTREHCVKLIIKDCLTQLEYYVKTLWYTPYEFLLDDIHKMRIKKKLHKYFLMGWNKCGIPEDVWKQV